MQKCSISILFTFLLSLASFFSTAQSKAKEVKKTKFNIIAYYAGPANLLDSFPTQYLTHIIFSFGHLKNRQLHFYNSQDTVVIQKMISLKKSNPNLKVMLSLGGWGGCYTCSNIFDTASARIEFAQSVKKALDFFNADGIDLDWEYPAIQGVPNHPYMTKDKANFSELIKTLRNELGPKLEISFAAGGFDAYIDSSIEWKTVMPLVNRLNIMTYDLIHGYSKISGHHTPLFSNSKQQLSCHSAIQKLRRKGVPSNKLVIGAAFYARLFETSDTINNGLYRPCNFVKGISHRNLKDSLALGYQQFWDTKAQAPYAFNNQRKIFTTYDDNRSITLKTNYALQNNLNGIMFWQLIDDDYKNGLLQTIYYTSKKRIK
jgi:chitinase